jgi:hypothetical protein
MQRIIIIVIIIIIIAHNTGRKGGLCTSHEGLQACQQTLGHILLHMFNGKYYALTDSA